MARSLVKGTYGQPPECPVSGMKDPNSAGARRVMRSSGRLTRTVALVKSKYKTWIVSAV